MENKDKVDLPEAVTEIKAKLNYGLAGEYKIDIYSNDDTLVNTTDWFSNYIPVSGLEHPRKFPFAACFESLSVGTSATLNNIGTTGLTAPLNSTNSQNTIPVEQYMGKRFWESGTKKGGAYIAGSCGTHFDKAGPIMFRGWRVPTGTGFAKATTTIKEFAVFPATSGLSNEKGNIGDSPWTNGVTPCFSRVVKKVAIQKDQYAIVNYRLQVKMAHTGASIFAPETFDVTGIHPDSDPELSGLWGGLSGKFKQVAPAISYVTEFGKTKKPKWGDYLEPACTGYAKGGFWYLSPDKYQFIGSKTGGPIIPSIPYLEGLYGYHFDHIMIEDGNFPTKIAENKYPKGNARRGDTQAQQGGGIDIPSTGDFRKTAKVNYAAENFHVDDGQVVKEPYDLTQFGNTDRKRKQRIKSVWAANQGRGNKYRFRSMIFGGTTPDAGEGGGEVEIFPSIDFMFSDDSGRYPSYRLDIGVTGATLTHSGRNYKSNEFWNLRDGRITGKRRASVTNDQTITDGATPVGNSGTAAILSGVGSTTTSEYGEEEEEWKGFYTDLKIGVTGQNYTGVPEIDINVIPSNWDIEEQAGKNPEIGYFDLSGMFQSISGYVTGKVNAGPWGEPFNHGSGARLGAYIGTNGSDSSDFTPPTVIIQGGTGITGSGQFGAFFPSGLSGAPVTGAATPILQLYHMSWSGAEVKGTMFSGHTGKVWGVIGLKFDSDPWRGQYKGTGYAAHPDHDDMEIQAWPTGRYAPYDAGSEAKNSGAIPLVFFSGGSLLRGDDRFDASGRLVLTDNWRASGTIGTGLNYMIKDQYVGGASTLNQTDGTATSNGWWQHTGNNVLNYTKLGSYPYKDNLNILNLFLELIWSGQDSGVDGN